MTFKVNASNIKNPIFRINVMNEKFLLPMCEVDESIFCDAIDCGNFESTGDVTLNVRDVESGYTQAQQEEFLRKLGIDSKDFFEDE